MWKTWSVAESFPHIHSLNRFHKLSVNVSLTISLLPLHSLPKAIGFAHEFDDVGAMGEPVEESQGQSFIPENLGPVCKFEVGGDNYGYPLVEGGDKLKDQLRPDCGEGDETQFVQHDQSVPQRGGDELFQPRLFLR